MADTTIYNGDAYGPASNSATWQDYIDGNINSEYDPLGLDSDPEERWKLLSATGSGSITATLTWTPSSSSDKSLPPTQIFVLETAEVNAANGTGRSSVGPASASVSLSDATTTPDQQGDMIASGSQWDSIDNSAGNTVVTVPKCTLSGSASSPPVSAGGSGADLDIDYTVTVEGDAVINLAGTTPDSSGNLHILVGQQCTATLAGIPSGCTASNIQWSVDGQTVQSNNWTISSDHTNATFSGYNAAYTYTQATSSAPPPSWYWDDQGGSETISCTATITPPSGQGAAFPISATQDVTLEVPAYQPNDPVGAVSLDAVWLGDYNSLSLHAGGSKTDMIPGIYFKDTVTTPTTPYSGTGTWYRVQLVTVSRYETSLTDGSVKGAPGNGVTGALDVASGGSDYKYNSQTINANGQTFDPNHNTTAENDSPGLPVSDAEQEYNVKQETFQDYIVYTPPTPPSGNSIAVPLFYYQWSWNADVKEPLTPSPRSWSYWNNAPTGGTITAPSGTQRMFIYPTWSSFSSQQLP